MKKFLMITAILIASISTANAQFMPAFAGDPPDRKRNIVICYLNAGVKLVNANVRFISQSRNKTTLTFDDGGELTFSGAYSCMTATNNDKLIEGINAVFGNGEGDPIPPLPMYKK